MMINGVMFSYFKKSITPNRLRKKTNYFFCPDDEKKKKQYIYTLFFERKLTWMMDMMDVNLFIKFIKMKTLLTTLFDLAIREF